MRSDLYGQLSRHIEIMGAVVSQTIYLPDLLMWSFGQRSFALLDGFLCSFDSWNLLVAAPLVRLQIDNLVKLSYAATCPNMDALTQALLGGQEFRTMTDVEGKRLTDRRLVELAAPMHAWLEPVYERACGWVHLSPLHLFLGTQAHDGQITGRIPLHPDVLPQQLLEEVLGAMRQATEELLTCLRAWADHKASLPQPPATQDV
jgi:hypothetical protein